MHHPTIPNSLAFAVVTGATAVTSRYIGAVPIHRHDLLEHFLGLFALVVGFWGCIRLYLWGAITPRIAMLLGLFVAGISSVLWEGFANHPSAALAGLDWGQMACDWIGIGAAVCYLAGVKIAPRLRPALAALCMLCLLPLGLISHPGRLDQNGGHVDRKTEQYHTHRAPAAQPAQSSGATQRPPSQN